MRVAVFGGTGHFGARICRRLIGDPSIDLVVTSRSENRAARLAEDLRAHSHSVASAAIDQGVAVDKAGLDLDGEAHDINAPDLGAYEFGH